MKFYILKKITTTDEDIGVIEGIFKSKFIFLLYQLQLCKQLFSFHGFDIEISCVDIEVNEFTKFFIYNHPGKITCFASEQELALAYWKEIKHDLPSSFVLKSEYYIKCQAYQLESIEWDQDDELHVFEEPMIFHSKVYENELENEYVYYARNSELVDYIIYKYLLEKGKESPNSPFSKLPEEIIQMILSYFIVDLKCECDSEYSDIDSFENSHDSDIEDSHDSDIEKC